MTPFSSARHDHAGKPRTAAVCEQNSPPSVRFQTEIDA